MRRVIISILIISSFVSYGQMFDYKADINKIDSNGFCKILLPQEVTSKLKYDFSDVRIYNSENIEVPYILRAENAINEKELFFEYKIIEKKHLKTKGYTRIVIHNPAKNKINNIVLRIKNADVRKQLKLNASYDNKTWYVLKDNYYYNSINSYNETSEIRVLNFPLSDYEYYELLIDDFYDKPINITKAGFYDLVKENGKYSEIKNISFLISNINKESIIKIPVNNNYIDKISFKISNPKYYHRNAEIYVKKTVNARKQKKVYESHIGSFNIISNSSNSFNIRNLQTDTLFVKIQNNDNQAVKIYDIKLYQLNKYLITELSSEDTYTLKFSDKKANKAVYDLEYFSDKIPENLNILEVSNIRQISKTKTNNSNNINFSSYWLWISVIGIAALLAYMSYSMIREKK